MQLLAPVPQVFVETADVTETYSVSAALAVGAMMHSVAKLAGLPPLSVTKNRKRTDCRAGKVQVIASVQAKAHVQAKAGALASH